MSMKRYPLGTRLNDYAIQSLQRHERKSWAFVVLTMALAAAYLYFNY